MFTIFGRPLQNFSSSQKTPQTLPQQTPRPVLGKTTLEAWQNLIRQTQRPQAQPATQTTPQPVPQAAPQPTPYAQALESQIKSNEQVFIRLPNGMPDYDTFFKDEGYKNIKARQDSAYKRGSYDELDRLYEEEKTYNTAKQKEWNALKDSLAAQQTTQTTPQPVPQAAPKAAPQPTTNATENLEKTFESFLNRVSASLSKKPEEATTILEPKEAEPQPAPVTKDDQNKREAAYEAANLARKRLDIFGRSFNTLLAGSLSGQRIYNEPVRPANQSPRGPYTPIKNYGTPDKPNFMPAGPSRDPWKA